MCASIVLKNRKRKQSFHRSCANFDSFCAESYLLLNWTTPLCLSHNISGQVTSVKVKFVF